MFLLNDGLELFLKEFKFFLLLFGADEPKLVGDRFGRVPNFF